MKKKLLYASPVFPKQSGISDYSEALLPHLSDFFDIHLVLDNYDPATAGLSSRFKVIQFDKDIDFSSYDMRLYNFGNNPYFHSYIYEMHLRYPGFIILHDFVLYYLYAGYYDSLGSVLGNIYSESIISGDLSGFLELKFHLKGGNHLLRFSKPEMLPLNREVIDLASAVFVHSKFAQRLVSKVNHGKSCLCLPMIAPRDESAVGAFTEPSFVSLKYHIDDSDFVFSSLGFIAPTKQNALICRALLLMSDQHFKYFMIGEGDFVDDYLSDRIFKTGFVEQSEYDSLLKRSDIILNLRYPSMGETSISLIHAMSFGKVCVVTDDAWFSELPDDVVVKVPANIDETELALRLKTLISSKFMIKTIGERAKEFVLSHHSPRNLAALVFQGMCK